MKVFTNDWSINPVFQMQNGLPYSAVIGSGSTAISAYSSGLNGAGQTWIPFIGRNTYKQSRVIVLDVRLEKQIPITVGDKTYKLQLMGEAFNLANHQNVTGITTSAYVLAANSSVTAGCTGSLVSGQAQNECSTMTYSTIRWRRTLRERLRLGDQQQQHLPEHPARAGAHHAAGFLTGFNVVIHGPISRCPRSLVVGGRGTRSNRAHEI